MLPALLGRGLVGGQGVLNLTTTKVRASPTPLEASGAQLRGELPSVPLFAGRPSGIAVVRC